MKNVSWLLVNMYLSSAVRAFSGNFSMQNEHQFAIRQPKIIYGPLLGFLLSQLLSNPALAKYPTLGGLQLLDPWLSYKPIPVYKEDPHVDTIWEPITNTHQTPILTTPPAQHHLHHHIQIPPNQQQIVNIQHPSSPTIIIADDSNPEIVGNQPQTITTNIETPHDLEPIAAESNVYAKRVKAPQYKKRRITSTSKPKKSVKRGTQSKYSTKRNKYNNIKRRKPTTTLPPDYLYDSYEDYTTVRYKSRRKTKPKRPSSESYEEEEEEAEPEESDISYYVYDSDSRNYEYDSYEETTTLRPKKRRRTTPRRNMVRYKKPNRNRYGAGNNNRRQHHQNTKKRQGITPLGDYSGEGADYEYDDYDGNRQEPFTETVTLRQRQETTTPTESSTDSSSTTPSTTTTTTESETSITNGTTVRPSVTADNTTTNTTGYGYGPSNGHENISITYGPPHTAYGPPQSSYGPPRPLYSNPHTAAEYHGTQFADWYSNEATRNAIVKKVHDIIGFDNVFERRIT